MTSQTLAAPIPARPGFLLRGGLVLGALAFCTVVAAMAGALFILDDPIFNGLAISLIFGILVSTVLTLLVIPLLYYALLQHRARTTPSG